MHDLRDATWTKAARSTATGENCVETALRLPGGVVAVRDSKHPERGAIVVTSAQWRRLTRSLKAL